MEMCKLFYTKELSLARAVGRVEGIWWCNKDSRTNL